MSINPKFYLYHANARGTGSALSMDIRFPDGDAAGHINLMIAPQSGVSSFDWGAALTAKLDFSDLSQMLQVFRGETESINDGRGLFHRAPDYNTVITFCHQIDTSFNYKIEISRARCGMIDAERFASFVFNSAEALGLSIAIENVLGCLVFGVPHCGVNN